MRVSAGVAAVFGALLLVGVGGAASFDDPVGDTYGPDIKTVETQVARGALTINVEFANRDALENGEIVEIDADLDAKESTGDDGIDLYAVLEGGQPSTVLRFEKDDYVETTAAHVTIDAEGAHLRVPLGFVGRQVKLDVETLAVPPELPDPEDPLPPPPPTLPDSDNAPDAGVYTVQMPQLALKRATVTYSPAQPRAGTRFKVANISLQFGGAVGAVKATSYSCSATLAGKKLAGGCSWLLPKSARGQKLRVAVVATLEGRRFALPARTFTIR